MSAAHDTDDIVMSFVAKHAIVESGEMGLADPDFSAAKECLVRRFFSQGDGKQSLLIASRITRFLSTICDNLELHRRKLEEERSDAPRPKVLIVGAGPRGLLAALEAYLYGGEVEIVEKRLEYTRNVWFDLYPEPYSPSVKLLDSWGFFEQSMEYEEQPIGDETKKSKVVTIQCNKLERFLSKVVSTLGIHIRYGYEFLGWCSSDSNSEWPRGAVAHSQDSTHAISKEVMCRTANETDKSAVFHIPFDILIGADGTRSTVGSREEKKVVQAFQTDQMNVSSHIVTVRPSSNYQRAGIYQTALIVNFKPVADNATRQYSCPEVEKLPTGMQIDPLSPTFHIRGVTSAWKRFYLGHCHLQVLFDHEMGTAINAQNDQALRFQAWTNPSTDSSVMFATSHQATTASTRSDEVHVTDQSWEDHAYPWDVLLELAKLIFARKPATIRQLKQMISRYAGPLSVEQKYDMTIFNAQISVTDERPLILPIETPASDQGQRMGIKLLVGDAKVSAHFRLGIGVNYGFATFGQHVGALVSSIYSSPHGSNVLRTRDKKIEICADGSMQTATNPLIDMLSLLKENIETSMQDLVNYQVGSIFIDYMDFLSIYFYNYHHATGFHNVSRVLL